MDIVFTVSDKEMARILTAFGQEVFDPTTGQTTFVDATLEVVGLQLENMVRNRVLEHEVSAHALTKRAEIGAEIWESKTTTQISTVKSKVGP